MKGFSLILLVVALLGAGCTERGKPFVEHTPDTRHDDGITTLKDESDSLATSPAAQAWEIKAQGAKDVLKDVLVPLGERVLASQRVQDAHALNDRFAQEELAEFNRLFLQLSTADQNRPEFNRLADRYVQTAKYACQSFADGCRGMRYLQIAPNSYEVLKLLAARRPKERFHLLMIALKIKPLGWDHDLVEAILQNQDAAASNETVRSMMYTALKQLDQQVKDPQQLRKSLENIHAWSLVNQLNQLNAHQDVVSLDSMLASAGMIYDEAGHIDPDFQKLIQVQAKDSNGILQRQKILLSQVSFHAAAAGVTPLKNLDETSYILDGVFSGNMSSDMALALFTGIHRSAAELTSETETYLRLQFMISLAQSTKLAAQIFSAHVPTERLLTYAINQSGVVRTVWSQFKNRARILREFILRALQTRADAQASKDRVQNIFDSIDKSIAMSAAYPHQIILFYLLAKKNFQVRIPSTGEIYSSSDMMRDLFTGDVPLIFNYSGTVKRFGQFDLIYAFDRAVRSGLFQSAGIDVDDFISETIRRISYPITLQVNTDIQNVENHWAQANTYAEAKNACREFQDGAKIKRSVYFGDLIISPYYGSLKDALFEQIDSGSHSHAGEGSVETYSMGLMFYEEHLSDTIEQARLNLGDQLRLGKALLTSYQSYLRVLGFTPQQITSKTGKSANALAQITTAREQILSSTSRWYKDIGSCYFKAAEKHFDISARVLLAEREYLKHIHRLMTQLRQPGLSEADKQAIQKSIQFQGLPSGYTGQDRITASTYHLNQVDLLIRISQFLSHGLKTETANLPAIAPNVEVDFGNRLDLDVPLVRSALVRNLNYTPSEDDFANAGLRSLFTDIDPLLVWNGDDSTLVWSNALQTLVSLYRLERELYGTNRFFPAQTIWDTQEDLLKVTDFSPLEREIYGNLGFREKIPALQLNHRMLLLDPTLERVERWMGLFDLPAQLIQEGALGATWAAYETGSTPPPPGLRQTFDQAGEEYFSARAHSNRLTNLIPYNPDVDRELDQSVGHFVQSEVGSILQFEKDLNEHLAALRALPQAQAPHVDVNLDTSIVSPLIDPNLENNFRAKVQTFNSVTNSCFAVGRQKPCDDFQP